MLPSKETSVRNAWLAYMGIYIENDIRNVALYKGKLWVFLLWEEQVWQSILELVRDKNRK